MSVASKVTLVLSVALAVSTVAVVHHLQSADKETMHLGVVRDIERQRQQRERQLDFDVQHALEAELKKEQTVHDSSSAAPDPSDRPAE